MTKMQNGDGKKFISFNVGGKFFQTSRETLTKEPNGILASMLNEDWSRRDNFLDRDPKLFRYVLNFLRTGIPALPEDEKILKELKIEADFYGISSLKTAIETKFAPNFQIGDKVEWNIFMPNWAVKPNYLPPCHCLEIFQNFN